MADQAHPFTDLASGRTVVLHVGGRAGVEHPDCGELADVSAVLDAFYCAACRWNGRISGAWYVHMLDLARVDDG